jgi:predicted DNA-binding transcriptional regulator YafY
MLRELQRYLAAGNPIELIYLDSRNRITKRVVRLLSIENDVAKAYCYTRRAPRTFQLGNILAVGPIRKPRAS